MAFGWSRVPNLRAVKAAMNQIGFDSDNTLPTMFLPTVWISVFVWNAARVLIAAASAVSRYT